MRNKFKTSHKKSTKPVSRNKRYRLKELEFEAALALTKWFVNYMNGLKNESKRIL